MHIFSRATPARLPARRLTNGVTTRVRTRTPIRKPTVTLNSLVMCNLSPPPSSWSLCEREWESGQLRSNRTRTDSVPTIPVGRVQGWTAAETRWRHLEIRPILRRNRIGAREISGRWALGVSTGFALAMVVLEARRHWSRRNRGERERKQWKAAVEGAEWGNGDGEAWWLVCWASSSSRCSSLSGSCSADFTLLLLLVKRFAVLGALPLSLLSPFMDLLGVVIEISCSDRSFLSADCDSSVQLSSIAISVSVAHHELFNCLVTVASF